jgi:hypothetical protein
MGRRRQGKYGEWGKHIELFEMFESWAADPEAQAAVAESEGFELAEGTGAPEGRADFPLFLLTTIRHQLRKGFNRRASIWDQYMGQERAEDFREHTVSQLNGLTGMGPVPEYDEYPRIRSSEEMGPPYSVGKHGGVYGITYEMVVNDEANLILNRTPTELGKMNAAYVSQVAVALIESNPDWIDGKAFFTAEAREGLPDGNEFTGAGAEPTEDNLVTIIEQMRNTTDAEGFPIDIEPENVLTRSERVRLNFKRIKRSQETVGAQAPASGTSMDKGNMNPLAGEEEILPGKVIVEQYLKDPNDWILFANVERPAFIIAFLRDQKEPMIARQDSGVQTIGGAEDPYTLDFDEIPFKVRHVFGVALGDPRAAIRARRS